MSCNKPYAVVSTNSKMSGSAVPKNMKYGGSYKDGGMIKSYEKGGSVNFPDLTGDGRVTRADILKGRGVYEKGGMVTMPRKTAKQEMMDRMMEDPRKPGAYMRNTRRDIENAPRYTEKERMEMERVKGEEMNEQMNRAYERTKKRPLT
jgi:hypothetical protein